MRLDGKKLFVPVLALCFLPIATGAQLQTIPLGGTASRLSSVTYYDPPNEQQVKVRLSGDEMTPLPGALFDVKKLTIERYDLGGKLEAVVRAPECVYAQLDGIASSPGHLEVELAGGKIHIEGDGFMWQQKDQFLVISNHVHTIIKTGVWNLTKQ